MPILFSNESRGGRVLVDVEAYSPFVIFFAASSLGVAGLAAADALAILAVAAAAPLIRQARLAEGFEQVVEVLLILIFKGAVPVRLPVL